MPDSLGLSEQERNIDNQVKKFAAYFMEGGIASLTKADAIELEEGFKELEECLTNKEYRGYFYFRNKGFQKYANGENIDFYQINEEDFGKAFKAINKILGIIRKEKGTIYFYRVQDNGNVMVKYGLESELGTSTRTVDKKAYVTKKLSLLESQLINLKVSESFNSHYRKYSDIANNHIQKNNLQRKYKSSGGYITEAFEQHLNKMHHNISYSANAFNEEIDHQEVAIELWEAAHNKVAWYRSGDVGSKQIKEGNTTLASFSSIKNVANELIAMYKDPEKFDIDKFNNLFNMTNESIVDWESIKNSTYGDIKEIINEFSNSYYG